MSRIIEDLRYAVRQLRKSPGFGFTAIVTPAEAVAPVLIGATAGVALASVAGRIIASLLFDVHATNPPIAAISFSILVVIGVVASLIPAARAALIDPMNALRTE
jgi:ABC-type antimicrobial peptide transport system permease subunit